MVGRLLDGGHQVFANDLKPIRPEIMEKGATEVSSAKATVFITSMDDFTKVNEVYAGFFSDKPPARSCVEVSGLAKGAKVEIEAIALLP